MTRLLPLLIMLAASSAFAQTPTVVSVVVSPVMVYVKPNETAQLTLTATFSDNSTKTETATWSSLAPAIATVSATGLVTGVGVGMVPVAGTYEGKSARASVTVLAPPLPTRTPTPTAAPSVTPTSKFTAVPAEKKK